MKDRLFKILRNLNSIGSGMPRLVKVEEFGEDVFDIALECNPPIENDWLKGHRTFLRFEVFGEGEKVNILIEHLWGWLDTDLELNEFSSQLLRALIKNTFTYNSSNYYLGVREIQNEYYVSLNRSICFLTKWSDGDIAEILHQYFFDLAMGLGMYDKTLTAFRNYCEA